MQIGCDCGAFRAELTQFPAHSPGRLMCYCRDCQRFLEKLDRQDLLDPHGGTEVIPVYPGEVRIISGQDQLICNQLSPEGLFRWSTRCCNAPIGNLRPKFPWFGILHSAFRAADPGSLQRIGSVRSRIYGRHATGEPPFRISDGIGVRDALVVLPFIMRGVIGRKYRGSPLMGADDVTPISPPRLL